MVRSMDGLARREPNEEGQHLDRGRHYHLLKEEMNT